MRFNLHPIRAFSIGAFGVVDCPSPDSSAHSKPGIPNLNDSDDPASSDFRQIRFVIRE